jgi:hypothetical protein
MTYFLFLEAKLRLPIMIAAVVWIAALAASYFFYWWLLPLLWFCHPVIAVIWAIKDYGGFPKDDWNDFWLLIGISLVPVWNTSMFLYLWMT